LKKTSWTDGVRNEEVLHRVKDEGRLAGLVTSCVGNAFCNTLLEDKHKKG